MKSNRALLGAILFPALFLFIVVLNFTLFAANEDSADLSPFERYLALIPLPSEPDLLLGYADYAVFEETREGTRPIDSAAEYRILYDSDSEDDVLTVSLWKASVYGIASGPASFILGALTEDETASTMGFERLAIDTGLTYGSSPAQVDLFGGDWEAQAIIDAHLARDYTQEQRGDFTLLCPPNGCESGMDVNPAAIDLNNIFGGDLGRQQPVLVAESWVLSSPSIDSIEQVLRTVSNEEDSLLDLPSVQAAVNQFAATEGRLRQVWLIDPLQLGFYEDEWWRLRALLPNSKPWQETPPTAYPIPPYAFLTFSDHITDTHEIARAWLFFRTEADAQQAAESMQGRLQYGDYSFSEVMTYQDFFTRFRDTQIETTVRHDEDTEYYIAEVRMTTTVPPTTPSEDSGLYVYSSLAFRQLIHMLLQRDMLWLLPSLPAEDGE